MRRLFAILLLVLASSDPVAAGLPHTAPDDVGRMYYCSIGVSGQSLGPCHFVFRADGGYDVMGVALTLTNDFHTPVPYCSTSVTLALVDEPGSNLCECGEPLHKWVVTDANGHADLEWSRLGGHGTLVMNITAYPYGPRAFASEEIQFTSTDLDGSCEPAPAVSTTVIDLGIWAYGLQVPAFRSDYDCSGGLNDVIDLGVWASGLGIGCD